VLLADAGQGGAVPRRGATARVSSRHSGRRR